MTRRFDLIEDHLEALAIIYQMGLQGVGTAAIARHLNSANVPTFSTIKKATNRGKLWTPETVNLILHSPALKGAYQPITTHFDESNRRKRSKAGELIEGFFPAVMNSGEWDELQNILNLRSKNHGRGNQKNITNLFGSLLTYGPDKSPIVITTNQNNQKLMTSRLMRLGTAKTISFPYDVFEFVFLKRMADRLHLDTATGEELEILRSEFRLRISQFVQSIQVWFAGDSCNRRCCLCKVILNDSSIHLFSIRKRRGKPPETEPLEQDTTISFEKLCLMEVGEVEFEERVESLNTKEEIPGLIPLEDFGIREQKQTYSERLKAEQERNSAEFDSKKLTDDAYRELAERYAKAYLRSAEENPREDGIQISDEMKDILREAGAEFVDGELNNTAFTARVLIELTYQMGLADGGNYWRDPEHYADFYNLKSVRKIGNALGFLEPQKLNRQPSEPSSADYNQFDPRFFREIEQLEMQERNRGLIP